MRARIIAPLLFLSALIAALPGARGGTQHPDDVPEHPGPREWKPELAWYGDMADPSATVACPKGVEQSEIRIRDGDDPAWAAPGFDDSGWMIADRDSAMRKNRGIFWVRIHVRTTDGRPLPSGVMLGQPAGGEFYWDGTLFRKFGQPGNDRAHEVAGQLYTLFELPATDLMPGEHVVALRLSTYRFNRPDPSLNLLLLNVDPAELAEWGLQHTIVPLAGVGAFLIIGVAGLILWLSAERQRAALYFSIVSLGSALTIFTIDVRHLFPVPYSWSFPIWATTELIVAVTTYALVALSLELFPLSRGRWILIAFCGFEAATLAYQMLAFHLLEPIRFMVLVWGAAFLSSLAVLVWPVCRKRLGAVYGLGGLVLGASTYFHGPEHFLFDYHALAVLPVLMGFIAAIGLALRKERQQARETKLVAARLELELLRKSLQPHFLMNTLTALAQAIEENPPRAVKLIEDLADELRSLARFSEQKEVPIERELDLCRMHLRVMSVRTERVWNLEATGLDPEATVPPALFFTLIENGFTHQEPIGGENTFRLRGQAIADGHRYTFFSPGHVGGSRARANGGSGLRYVKARLEESWMNGWRFDQRPVPGGWETVIELRRHGELNGAS